MRSATKVLFSPASRTLPAFSPAPIFALLITMRDERAAALETPSNVSTHKSIVFPDVVTDAAAAFLMPSTSI